MIKYCYTYFSNSRIDYFETRRRDIFPEKMSWYAYYHEFYAQKEIRSSTPEFEKFLSDRKIGHIIVDKPILIKLL